MTDDKYARALARLDDIQQRNVTWNNADAMAILLRALLVERQLQFEPGNENRRREVDAAIDAFGGGK